MKSSLKPLSTIDSKAVRLTRMEIDDQLLVNAEDSMVRKVVGKGAVRTCMRKTKSIRSNEDL